MPSNGIGDFWRSYVTVDLRRTRWEFVHGLLVHIVAHLCLKCLSNMAGMGTLSGPTRGELNFEYLAKFLILQSS